MSTFTENYNLVKPDAEDYYDVTNFNENFDTIDALIATTAKGIDTIGDNLENTVTEVSRKIGTPEDTAETVFGKLNEIQAYSPIKSIQHVTFTLKTNCEESICSISPIDLEKTIILLERLENTHTANITYTLNSSNITIKHGIFASNAKNILGFWIIEFC